MNDGQPGQRSLDEAETGATGVALSNLMGIVKGIVCDNHLADAEVRFLATWLDANKPAAVTFPGSIIARRVSEVLSDGVLTDDEKTKLLADLKMLSTSGLVDAVSALPTHVAAAFASAPVVEIPNRIFVLTGEFLFGSRPTCERAIMKRGGSVGSGVSARTNYVVVGGMSTPTWIEQTFPHKIRQAVELGKSGQANIAVIRESDWAAALH